VQIGITLIGIFAGAYGGATLSEPLAAGLVALGLGADIANPLAFVTVVVAITYLSLIVGELVPKQLALGHPDVIARFVAPPMALLARAVSPMVWLLELSSGFVLRLLRVHRLTAQQVTDEEIKSLIAEAAATGVVQAEERHMLDRVMSFVDLPVQAVMTPRPEIAWLDADDDAATLLEIVRDNPYSQFPVARGELDQFEGMVQVRDLLTQTLAGEAFNLQPLLRQPLVVLAGMSAVSALQELKQQPLSVALVTDEYGGVVGLVTMIDILAALTGELAETLGDDEPTALQRGDGSWLLDGALALEDVRSRLGLAALPERGDYHTLAGLLLHHLGDIPSTGAAFEWNGLRFEVIDMDGRRIDKVLVTQREEDKEDLDKSG
jgi:putative hemolysin